MKNKALYENYKDGKLDEQVESFLTELSKHESKPLRLQTPEEVRRNSSIRAWVRKRGKLPCIDNLTIPGRDCDIPIRIYIPEGQGPYPVLVYFHGGGYVFGSLDEADHICGSFSNEIPAVVVSVGYRLSPENKYPCAIEDAYSAVLWTSKEITQYGGNPEIIGVAGESAGANAAAVVCQMLRDRNGPRVCFQLLLCPTVDMLNMDTESYRLFGDGVWLSKVNIEYYYSQYLQNREQAKEGYVSPLLSSDLKNLPPAHIVTAEFDILRDEGETYVKRLKEAGNNATFKRYGGVIHSFFVLNKIFNKANEAIDDFVSVLQSNLQGGDKKDQRLLMSHCVFPAPDIIKTSEYYERVLGFKAVRYLDAREPHVCLYRDATEIILIKSNGQEVIPNRKLCGYGYDAYFITEVQEELQEEFMAAGAKIVRPLVHTDYRNREFVIEDVDGRWIGFGIKGD